MQHDEQNVVANEEMFEKFLAVQKQELDVRLQEIKLADSDQDNQKEIALASLEAQKDDRQASRVTYGKESTKTKIFAGLVLFGLGWFILELIKNNQADMALELVKMIGFTILGGFGGYGLAKRHENRQNNEE